jgi:hypothetical protein
MSREPTYKKKIIVEIPKEWIESCVRDKENALFKDTIKKLEYKQETLKKSIDYLYKELKEIKSKIPEK